jgi:HEAT repeat protein
VGLLLDPAIPVRAAASHALEKLGWHPGDDSQRVMQILAMGRTDAAASLGSQAVAPLIEVMRTGSPNKQFEAVKALSQIEDPRVKMAMLEALRKSNPAIRIAALGALERMAIPDTSTTVERCLQDSNPSVRGAAVEAMRACGGANAVPALLKMLHDESWEVRQSTLKALGDVADPASVEEVAKLLDDPDRDVRESALGALGHIGSRRAIPHLVLALVDVDSAVRAAAAAALKNVDRNWEKHPSVFTVLPRIKAALEHSEYWVRHSALKLFAQLQIKPETVTERPVAGKDANPPHAAFGILSDLMYDHDRDVRLAAIEAFRHLQEVNALPLLDAALHDVDENVQLAARQALEDIA